MRMYLSSYRLGDHPERLTALLRTPGPAAVIANAMDAVPDRGVAYELTALGSLGIEARELDLRDHDSPERLREALAAYAMVWVRGGNVFELRHAMRRSGADRVLPELVRANALVYAGYSAGCCVLAPSLRGLETIDDPGDAPIWDGLGVLDYAIVPHVQSDHPESEAADRAAARYRATGTPHRTLRDGEAIVIDGTRPTPWSRRPVR